MKTSLKNHSPTQIISNSVSSPTYKDTHNSLTSSSFLFIWPDFGNPIAWLCRSPSWLWFAAFGSCIVDWWGLLAVVFWVELFWIELFRGSHVPLIDATVEDVENPESFLWDWLDAKFETDFAIFCFIFEIPFWNVLITEVPSVVCAPSTIIS